MDDRAIGAIGDVARGELNFSWFRSAFRRDHGAKGALDFGHAVIGTTDDLDQYLHSYGPMIRSQWERISHLLAAVEPPTTVFDYGCGQGLAGLLANDLTRGRLFGQARDIVLVEPSSLALARAVALYARLAPDARVTAINRRFDEVDKEQVPATSPGATLHLFSNSLDLPGFDALTLLIATVRAGRHTILSVSHDRDFNGGSPQVEALAATMTQAGKDGHLIDCRSTVERFTCDNPSRSAGIGWLCEFEVKDG